MKMIFVYTFDIMLAKQGSMDMSQVKPILIVDPASKTVEHTSHVKIVGPAEVVFDGAPDHGLSPYVWIQGDDTAFAYEGKVIDWDYALGTPLTELARFPNGLPAT